MSDGTGVASEASMKTRIGFAVCLLLCLRNAVVFAANPTSPARITVERGPVEKGVTAKGRPFIRYTDYMRGPDLTVERVLHVMPKIPRESRGTILHTLTHSGNEVIPGSQGWVDVTSRFYQGSGPIHVEPDPAGIGVKVTHRLNIDTFRYNPRSSMEGMLVLPFCLFSEVLRRTTGLPRLDQTLGRRVLNSMGVLDLHRETFNPAQLYADELNR
jgi:hypothetical protein